MSEIISLRVTVAPANVAGNEAKSDFLPTVRGTIKRLVPQFPTGCNGAVHVRVESREGIVAPTQGGDFALSGITVPLDVDLPIPGNNPALRLVAWADAGNAFTHVIDFLAVVEPFGVI